MDIIDEAGTSDVNENVDTSQVGGDFADMIHEAAYTFSGGDDPDNVKTQSIDDTKELYMEHHDDIAIVAEGGALSMDYTGDAPLNFGAVEPYEEEVDDVIEEYKEDEVPTVSDNVSDIDEEIMREIEKLKSQ